MADIESLVFSGTINLGAMPVTRAGFGTVLIVSENTGSGFTERVRYYTSSAELLADTDAALGSTSVEYKLAVVLEACGLNKFAIGSMKPADSNSYVTALTAIAAADNDWYGLLTTTDAVLADQAGAAKWALANKKLYAIGTNDTSGVGGTGTMDIASIEKTESNSYASVWLHSEAAESIVIGAGVLGKLLSFDPDTTAPAVAHMTLSGVAIDSGLTTTEINNALGKRANIYSTSKGLGTAWEGLMADGYFMDQRLMGDWYEARLTEDLQQLASEQANAGTRIPYGDAGYAMIEGIGRKRDAIGIGAGWFDEFDDDGERAFRAVVPATGSDKATRKLVFTFRHRQAGAAHEFVYTANLENT